LSSVSLAIPFDNSYARLPAQFYAECVPVPVAKPTLIAFNYELAAELGIETTDVAAADLAQIFVGNQIPAGAKPLAMAYSGHQFGNLNPLLGDGRALLLGEVVDCYGQRRDIQLKGSGLTPFSRAGDGRAPIGPVLREYVLCEAMHALGVATTRALAAVRSGEWVYRQRREPGAIFTRVAASHIRVGSFQYFALRRDHEALRQLADHVIARHFNEESQNWPRLHAEADRGAHYLAMFEAICQRQAKLIAQWMQLGFIHGVMNTDNMTVSGETIDYGPCAFIDTFDPAKVFSSIDREGRYSWQNQPVISQWNLARLAEAILPIIDKDQNAGKAGLLDILDRYPQWHNTAWLELMRAKLGLSTCREDDKKLVDDLLNVLKVGKADYTLFFRQLCDVAAFEDYKSAGDIDKLFTDPSIWQTWLLRWQQRLAIESLPPAQRAQNMRAINPAVIPRNHRLAEVIEAAESEQDFTPFYTLLKVLSNPYAEQPEYQEYQQPPQPHEEVLRTFCGT
jgi:uncharacterized protein YdiU (UPF0061 family)